MPYIPGRITPSKSDYVTIIMHVDNNQDLEDASFREALSQRLVKVYQAGKNKVSSRRKRRESGSISATVRMMNFACFCLVAILL